MSEAVWEHFQLPKKHNIKKICLFFLTGITTMTLGHL